MGRGQSVVWVPTYRTGELMETDCRVFAHKRSRRRFLKKAIAKWHRMKRFGRIVHEIDRARDELKVKRLDLEMEALMIRIRNRLNEDFDAHHSDQTNPSQLFGVEHQERNHAAS